MGAGRGQLTMSTERQEIIDLIAQAQDSGARQKKACEVIGISAKTIQRWGSSTCQEDGRLVAKHTPKNKLSEMEYQRVLKVANSTEYGHLPPSQIVPKLADKGIYIASEATVYRILNKEKQLKHRNKNKVANKRHKPRALIAMGPNEVYTWDITYLPTQIRGIFLYLYLVLDIFSRKIVGWQVHGEELSALGADMMKDICHREKIVANQVVLHSDNGSPMKGATMLATLQELGIVPSFSRPSVSNDNPYSESVFRTLKYRPEYPEKPFSDIGAARLWVSSFVEWYNNEHQHSSIKFVTPIQRHNGDDIEILANRKRVYAAAKAKNPLRWSGDIKDWDYIDEVHLNPEKEKIKDEKEVAA
jgi:transposase InsO family protein